MTLMTQRRVRLLVIGVTLCLAVATIVAVARTYAVVPANNLNLPNKTIGWAGDPSKGEGAIDLHLKKEYVAVAYSHFAAYYPSNSTARDKWIHINDGLKGRVCNIYKPGQNGGVKGSIVIQTTTQRTRTDTRSYTYTHRINVKDVCKSGSAFFGRNIRLSDRSDRGWLRLDSSGYYMAEIEIFLDTNLGPKDVMQNDSNSLNYRVSLGGANASKGKLALLKTQKSDGSDFGLRSSYASGAGNPASKRVLATVGFGYPCSTGRPSAEDGKVRVYDADSVFGDTFMWVEKNGVKLNYSDYMPTSDARYTQKIASWDRTNKRWKLKDSNGSANMVTIKSNVITLGATYALFVYNNGHGSSVTPHANTLSVGVPKNSIYSGLSCAYSLQANMPRINGKTSGATYQAGGGLSVASSVKKNSGSVTDQKHAWQTYIVKYNSMPSAAARNVSGNSTTVSPCSRVTTADRVACAKFDVSSGADHFYSNSLLGSTSSSTKNYASPSQFTCFFTRIQKPTFGASGSTWNYSDMNCAKVANTYNLVPKTSTDTTAVTAGMPVTVTGSVYNDSTTSTGTTDATKHSWQVNVIKYTPGTRPTTSTIGANGTADPCVAYRVATSGGNATNVVCDTSWVPTRNDNFTGYQNIQNTPTFTVPSTAPIGTHYCFVTSVKKPTSADTGKWAHSAPACVVVGRHPKIQVWGYDTMTSGNIITSLSTNSGKTYGSWGEYAALSNGTNTNFATASGLAGGLLGGGAQSSWSALTGANTQASDSDCTSMYGCYKGVSYPIDFVNSLIAQCTPISGNASVSGFSNGVHCYDGNVTITGNLTMPNGTKTSDNTIPQHIVIAKNINIKNTVKTVDAWLIAVNSFDDPAGGSELASPNSGVINTCYDGTATTSNNNVATAGLSTAVCKHPLAITGPVVAKQVYLYRTAVDAGDKYAELFNLRADAFLWAYRGGSGGSNSIVAQTEMVTDLPPKF